MAVLFIKAFVSQIILFAVTCELVSLCLCEYPYISRNILPGPILEHEGKITIFLEKYIKNPKRAKQKLCKNKKTLPEYIDILFCFFCFFVFFVKDNLLNVVFAPKNGLDWILT